jgi:cystine transport system substrate-binding protein
MIQVAAAPSEPVSLAPAGYRTLIVSSTGYSLPGHTSTGIPVGFGVVAVDPSVIPLGTRITIPGYGDGVAADTGSGVRGADIDLWFPTLSAARAWGRRTVAITLH